MPTRRQMLAGLSVLVAGGLVWRACDNGVFSVGDGPAYEPWHDWNRDGLAPPLSLIRASILAANAHNTQPWLFRSSDDRIEIHADLSRNLGAFDPFRRELFISLGCALENLVIAAGQEGLDATVDLVPGTLPPNPGEGPVLAATVHLTPAQSPSSDPLFGAIPRRHTNRGAYDPARPVTPRAQAALQGAVDAPDLTLQLMSGDHERTQLGDLIVAATEQIIGDPNMAAASARWFRFDWDALQRHRDGITLDAAGLPPLLNAAAKIIPSPSPEASDQQWLKATRDVHVATAPVLGMVLVPELYDQATCLNAGRAWQRLHLTATTLGLAVQPLNQPVEIVDREAQRGVPARMARELARLTSYADGRPTFIFRVGYQERPARLSPRRAVKDVLIS